MEVFLNYFWVRDLGILTVFKCDAVTEFIRNVLNIKIDCGLFGLALCILMQMSILSWPNIYPFCPFFSNKCF